MRHLIALTLLIFLTATAGAEEATPKPESKSPPSVEETEVPLDKRIYFFQHKLLPKWTYQTDGAFFGDLQRNNLVRLREAASKIINPEYAERIRVSSHTEPNGILIVFPAPSSIPDCFFVFIEQHGENFDYLTYEKTLELDEDDAVGVVGSWSADGAHHNYGARLYSDASAFLADLQQRKDRQ